MDKLNFRLTFWKLQLTGWFLFFLLMIEERIRYEDDILGLAFIGFLITLLGFLISIILRWIYQRIHTDKMGFPSIILLAVTTSLIFGYLWADITAFYIIKYDILKPGNTPEWYRASAWERNLIVIIFLWNSMYFGIKYWQKSIEEAELRLHAEFEVEKSQIMQMQIQKELDYKNKELMSKTMYLAKHNDLLITLSTLIEDSTEIESGLSRELITKINDSMRIEDQWQEFDLWFKEVHEDFYTTLRNKFPDLWLCNLFSVKLGNRVFI